VYRLEEGAPMLLLIREPIEEEKTRVWNFVELGVMG
jgi:hypothetical protein